jgi:hypothetical protein
MAQVFSEELTQHKYFSLFILGTAVVICTLLEYAIHYAQEYPLVYTHVYYIFIVIVAIFFNRNTVFFGLYLAVLYLVVEIITVGEIPLPTVFRAGIFVIVALLAGYIFEEFRKRQGALLAYVAEKAIKRESPINTGESGAAETSPQTAAGRSIQALFTRRDVHGLIAALESRDMETRYRAAIALGEMKEPSAVEPLAQLLKDDNSGVRWEAAEALGKIGEPALGTLISALFDDDDDIRWRAAIALGDIGDAAAVEPLIRALGDHDPYVRSRVVRSLSKIGVTAIKPLRGALHAENDEVRTGAEEALNEIEQRAHSHRG